MILINKNPEPAAWKQHRETPGADYESIFELRESLYNEQGGICAYCMRRLKPEVRGTVTDNVVEHIYPRTACETAAERMDYSNIVMSCNGVILKDKLSKITVRDTHCDEHKKHSLISFTPFNLPFISSLRYQRDGTIKSSNEKWDEDINLVLNLNNSVLKANRKAVRDGIIKKITQGNNLKKSTIVEYLDRYSQKDSNGLYLEYSGVAIWTLKSLLNRL